ncbi:MAG: hypothetical protein MUF04_08480 [Akkermansiaceae bacterium]|nr:hypothetical protein [Akkermansiaceae bacterium]
MATISGLLTNYNLGEIPAQSGYPAGMPTKRQATASGDTPDFAVRRNYFDRFFEKPLSSSTFHDLVNKGLIVRMKALKGFYLLNASLRRLGLPPVGKIDAPDRQRSMEDIVRLAFTLIDPVLFPAPAWMLFVETVDVRDLDHARLIAGQHRENVMANEDVVLKINYFAGVLDALAMQEADARGELPACFDDDDFGMPAPLKREPAVCLAAVPEAGGQDWSDSRFASRADSGMRIADRQRHVTSHAARCQ